MQMTGYAGATRRQVPQVMVDQARSRTVKQVSTTSQCISEMSSQ